MLKDKNPVLKIKIKKENSSSVNKLYEALFSLYCFILNDSIEIFFLDFLGILLSYLQLIAFIFEDTFGPIWNQDAIIEKFHNFFKYFHFIYLLKNNTTTYFAVISFIIIFDYFIAILLLVMSFRFKNDKLNILWPVTILKFCLPLSSFSFFGQSFLLKLTIFDCKSGNTFVNEEIKCRTGLWFSFLAPLTFLALLFHVSYAIITNLLYYKPKFINCDSNLLKKTNTLPDIVFIITKIGINILFILDKENEDEHWTILSILVLLSGTNAFYNLYYQNRVNKTLSLLNNILCLITFVSFLCLFIGKFFKSFGFSGSIYLFSCCPTIIFIFLLTNKINDLNYILIDYTEIDNPIDYLYYIYKYYDIIENKNNSRNNLATLKSLISKIEENCILVDCPLKKYLNNIKIGVEYRFLLYQYCEKLFQYGIEKFSDDISLKTNYSIFLITEMNDRKKASIILKTIKDKKLSFQNNYYVYISLRLINKNNFPSVNESTNFQYRNNIQEFKELIKKLLLLYHDFLSLLLSSRMKNIDNFNELNNLGSQIMKYNPKIDNIFNNLINVKADNIEILKLYSEFIEEVLKDEEKLKKCLKVTKLTYINNIAEIHEKNYSNFDIEILNEKGNIPYLIVSANKDYLGKILNISMDICKIFGYSKNEIIGQNINFLLPKLFRKKNDLLTIQQYEKHILKYFNDLNIKKEYFPDIIRKDLYGITKMRFLIELKLNIYFVKTEENKLVYIIEILNYNPIKIDLINNFNNNSKFCILTDDNFIIQSFTSNCYEYLKLNYEYIDSNVNIANFIKQFNEEYLNVLNNSILSKQSFNNNTGIYSEEKLNEKNQIRNNITPLLKAKLKNDMIIKKFSKKSKITWKILDELNLSNSPKIYKRHSKNIIQTISNSSKKIKTENNKYNNNLTNSNNYFEKNIYENEKNCTFNEKEIDLYMEIDKIIVKKELLGYYFYFTTPIKKNLINMSYIIPNSKKKEGKKNLVNLRKYQCKFKEINNSLEEYKLDSDKSSMHCSLIVKPNKFNNKIDKFNERSPKVSFKENEEDKNSSNFSSLIYKKSEINDDIFEVIKPNNKNNTGVITGEFVPQFSTHFSINIDRMSYFQLSGEDEDSYNYEEYLRKEAYDKIEECQKLMKKSSSKGSDSSSEEFEEIESGEISSSNVSNIKKESSNSYSHSNSFPQSPKNNNKSPNFGKRKSQNIKIEKGNSETNFNSNKRIFQQKRNSLINNYYKVELKNIRYWVFDYHKDQIVIGDKNLIVSKVESTINDLKSKDPLKGLNNNALSFLSIINKNKNKIKNHKDNINEESDIKESSDNNVNKNIVLEKRKTFNENKIIERKIYEALNKNEDEIPIKRLKIFVLLCYIVMMIYCFLLIIFDLLYIGYFKECLNIIKNLMMIKYCSHISIYYFRELTLLNFNMNEIEGGEYWNIPDNSKDNYFNLIKEELIKLLVENQSSMKIVYSSSLALSDNALKNISETILNIKMLSYPKTNNVKYDIYTALMQYNSAFYNLASSASDIKQNHTDLYNYIYNNLNGYKTALNILIDLYESELEIYKYNIFIVFSMTCILLIISALLADYFILQNSESAIETRGKYMKVFYGINEKFLNMLIFNCETLLNKLKSSEEQRYHEEDTLYESINDKMTFKKNQSQKQLLQNSDLNYDDNRMQNRDCTYNILFISFFLLFTLISYSNFIFSTVYIFKISRKSITISKLWFKLQDYHLEVINMFNSYREYLFDNQSFIDDMIVMDYIVQAERKELTSMAEDKKYIEANYPKLVNTKPDEHLSYNDDLCAFYVNDFFDSSDMCSEEIGLITKYDIYHLAFYFLEEIKIKKNIVRYKLKYENIVGNLTEYKYLDYLEDENIPKKGSYNNLFRLNLFNDDQIHSHLNLVFFSIILPFTQDNRKRDFNYFSIDKVDKYLILVNAIFISILSFLFFFHFLPVINYINNIIYKTKNMLSIIPLSILSTHNGVKELLNLSDK